MASSGVKDFFRQKKKGGVAKTSSSSKKKTQQYTGGASVGSANPAQTSALISHGSLDLKGNCWRDWYAYSWESRVALLFYNHNSWCNDDVVADDFSEQEEQLRQFDMDMKFGPCIGVNRLQRWERASAMGLQPSPHLQDLLTHASSIKNHNNSSSSPECLWEGKI
jgi:DNA polymerase delta subunit 4